MGNPLIKAVSFSYGVRRAMGGKKQRELQKRVKDEMRREAHRKRRGSRRAMKTAGKASRR